MLRRPSRALKPPPPMCSDHPERTLARGELQVGVHFELLSRAVAPQDGRGRVAATGSSTKGVEETCSKSGNIWEHEEAQLIRAHVQLIWTSLVMNKHGEHPSLACLSMENPSGTSFAIESIRG